MSAAATTEGRAGNGGADEFIEMEPMSERHQPRGENTTDDHAETKMEQNEDDCARHLNARLVDYCSEATVTAGIVGIVGLLQKMHYRDHEMSWEGVVAFLLFALSSLLKFMGLHESRRIKKELKGKKVPEGESHRVRGKLSDDQLRQVNFLFTMAYVSTVLLIAAALVLLHFMDGRWRWDAIALAVSALVFLAYAFQRNTESRRPPKGEGRFFSFGHIKAASWYYMDGHEQQLKHLLVFSAEAGKMWLSGQVGTVIGYVKDSSNQDKGYISPHYLMFVGNVLVLLLALLALVPPTVDRKHSGCVLLGLHSVAYLAVIVLATACFMATKEILREYTAVPFCLQLLLGMLCLFMQRTARQQSHGGAEQQPSHAVLSIVKLIGFFYPMMFCMVMTSSYSITGGTKSLSGLFQVFVGSMICTILTHSIRMLIVQIEDVRALPAKKCWARGTYVLTGITCVFGILVGRLQWDEFKKII